MAQFISFQASGILAAILLFVAGMFPVPVRGMSCYNCHLEPPRNHCTDSRQLMEARKDLQREMDRRNLTWAHLQGFQLKFTDLFSVCDDSMPFCVVESIIAGGQYKLMYRDCSDGHSFSTDVSKTRLASMRPDNVTHCAYAADIGAQVCITLCDSEDLCNGPSGSARPLPLWFTSLSLGFWPAAPAAAAPAAVVVAVAAVVAMFW